MHLATERTKSDFTLGHRYTYDIPKVGNDNCGLGAESGESLLYSPFVCVATEYMPRNRQVTLVSWVTPATKLSSRMTLESRDMHENRL